MIVARAPLRVSFGGGGTDLAAYYQSFGGLVLNASIDAYIYVVVSPSASGLHVISSDGGALTQRSALSPMSGDHDLRLPLAVIDECAPGASVRVFITGEVQSGTGLGSSSAATVALITALSAYTGRTLDPPAVAELASTIEIDHLGSPVGKQDQYASAVGGLNTFVFQRDERVEIMPLHLEAQLLHLLQRRLMLFFTGARRDAGSILAHQRRQSEERDPQTIGALHAIKSLGVQMRDALTAGDLDRFAELLHRSWEQKRLVTSGISTAYIDHCYTMAREAGATGGKITGAGGGGFLMLYCHEERQGDVIAALHPLGLEPFPFSFSSRGAEVILRSAAHDTQDWQAHTRTTQRRTPAVQGS